jgi:hypothetical protein
LLHISIFPSETTWLISRKFLCPLNLRWLPREILKYVKCIIWLPRGILKYVKRIIWLPRGILKNVKYIIWLQRVTYFSISRGSHLRFKGHKNFLLINHVVSDGKIEMWSKLTYRPTDGRTIDDGCHVMPKYNNVSTNVILWWYDSNLCVTIKVAHLFHICDCPFYFYVISHS